MVFSSLCNVSLGTQSAQGGGPYLGHSLQSPASPPPGTAWSSLHTWHWPTQISEATAKPGAQVDLLSTEKQTTTLPLCSGGSATCPLPGRGVLPVCPPVWPLSKLLRPPAEALLPSQREPFKQGAPGQPCAGHRG